MYLCRKADKLEGFILKPAAHDVGERGERILVQWGCVLGLVLEDDHYQRDNERQDTVHEDQELRILEALTWLTICCPVLMCHDAFLKHMWQ
jgi:hypothetical protein